MHPHNRVRLTLKATEDRSAVMTLGRAERRHGRPLSEAIFHRIQVSEEVSTNLIFLSGAEVTFLPPSAQDPDNGFSRNISGMARESVS